MDQQRTHEQATLEGNDNLQVTNRRSRRQKAVEGIKNGSVHFRNLPEELSEDVDITLALIRRYPHAWWNWKDISNRLKSSKAFVMTAAKEVKDVGPFLHVGVSKELRDDREIVLMAVQQDGLALEYVSEELRGDREIAREAVRRDSRALRFASQELRGDRNFVLEAVQQHGRALMHASEELRADRNIVLVAVRQEGMTLKFASQQLRTDREIVLEAVRQDGKALQFASTQLRGDREIVLAALLDSTRQMKDVDDIVRYMSGDLQNDPMVAGAIIRKGGYLQQDSEIMERLESVLLAVQTLPEAFTERVVDEASLLELYRWWEHSIWHKICMALHLEPPGMPGTGRLFVELSGLTLELRQSKELRHCAPVVGAILCMYPRGDWRDVGSYPTYWYDSDDSSLDDDPEYL